MTAEQFRQSKHYRPMSNILGREKMEHVLSLCDKIGAEPLEILEPLIERETVTVLEAIASDRQRQHEEDLKRAEGRVLV